MYCGKCGTKLPDEEYICPKCGADMSGDSYLVMEQTPPDDEKPGFFRRLMDKITGR